MAKSNWNAVPLIGTRTRKLWRQTLPDGTHLAVWSQSPTRHVAIVTDPSGNVTFRKAYTSETIAKSQLARKAK